MERSSRGGWNAPTLRPPEKFDNYRQIPSLKEYVLISHREKLVEVFRCEDTGRWTRTEARTHARARLDSVGCELDVDRLYRDVELHFGG
ncbi:MAG: Uma2 family endonuclease [Myxococcaceae bacterium]|nr:Uma2 family endonuclease [Myxococcaceae bacterium]